jgi:hypothetical protein
MDQYVIYRLCINFVEGFIRIPTTSVSSFMWAEETQPKGLVGNANGSYFSSETRPETASERSDQQKSCEVSDNGCLTYKFLKSFVIITSVCRRAQRWTLLVAHISLGSKSAKGILILKNFIVSANFIKFYTLISRKVVNCFYMLDKWS